MGVSKNTLYIIAFSIINCTLTAILIFSKLNALYSWLYTSDLFMYDQLLNETLKGNFGLEFTYGNQFGEHAYIFVLLLLPLKLLLGSYMVTFLVIMTPVVFSITGFLLFFLIATEGNRLNGFLGASLYLFTYRLIEALVERVYGFHPDYLGGFFAILFVLFLRIADHRKKIESVLAKWSIWVSAIFLFLFMSIKEEFALVSILFFLILFLLTRSKRHLAFTFISVVYTLFAFIFIELNQTEFNRTNTYYIMSLAHRLLNNPFGVVYEANVEFYLIIGLLSGLFVLGVYVSKHWEFYAVALFFMGLFKLSFSYIISDHSVVTWHNSPGIVMLTGGLILQYVSSSRKREMSILLSLLVLVSMISTVYYLPAQFHDRRVTDAELSRRRTAILELKKATKPEKITAIPLFAVFEWRDGSRFTFYPRGIDVTPKGIASYVILENEKIGTMRELGCFKIEKRNNYYTLFSRLEKCAKLDGPREKFMGEFGRKAIGLDYI